MDELTSPGGPSGPLRIHRRDDRGAVVLTLSGELDLATVTQLDEQLGELNAAPPYRILVDLRELTFMDSTGLASLIRAQRSADSNGHSLAFRRGPRQVQRLFDLTGTSDRFTFET